jgi:tRNA 2-selenouridine synthase
LFNRRLPDDVLSIARLHLISQQLIPKTLMAVNRIDINAFLDLAATLPVIDVRSEAEYAQAHFPGAHSLPLFNNEERRVIGTAYKQESQQKAIKIGLRYFGPKMVAMVEAVEKLLENNPKKAVIVYCWRGGMRSGGVGWLLNLYGFEVYTLAGGYKAFRRWGLAQFEQDYPFSIIGGYTGSGKTEVLDELSKKGHAVIDLEGLAHHKGSAFGNINMPEQPSQEGFENSLAIALWSAARQVSTTESSLKSTIWLEDESQRIGKLNIPTPMYRAMQQKPVYFLDIPFEERLHHIMEGYSKSSREKLVNAIMRIQKRLGGLETKNALNHIIEGNTRESFAILLRYYDKFYYKTLQLKTSGDGQVKTIHCPNVAAGANMLALINQLKKVHAGI